MFDTYAYAQRLKGVGFTEPQVDAMTQGLSEIAMARVATKEDVIGLGKDIRAEIREMEGRLVIRIVGANAAITAAIAGLIVAALKLL